MRLLWAAEKCSLWVAELMEITKLLGSGLYDTASTAFDTLSTLEVGPISSAYSSLGVFGMQVPDT